jgi:hypothetical protein
MAHANDAPRPLRALAPELSPAVEAAVMRALAGDPAQRYRAAGELVAALRDALLQPAREPSLRVEAPTERYPAPQPMIWPDVRWEAGDTNPLRAGGPVAATSPLPAAPPAVARRGNGRGWLALLLVLLMCAAGLAGGYVLASQLAGGLPAVPVLPTRAPAETAQPPLGTPAPTLTSPATPRPAATPMATATAVFTPVPAPQQMIQSLQDTIEAAKRDGRIKNPAAKELRDRLDKVVQALDRGDRREALDRLQVSRDYVGEQSGDGRIPQDFVTAWQQAADEIAAAIQAMG